MSVDSILKDLMELTPGEFIDFEPKTVGEEIAHALVTVARTPGDSQYPAILKLLERVEGKTRVSQDASPSASPVLEALKEAGIVQR